MARRRKEPASFWRDGPPQVLTPLDQLLGVKKDVYQAARCEPCAGCRQARRMRQVHKLCHWVPWRWDLAIASHAQNDPSHVVCQSAPLIRVRFSSFKDERLAELVERFEYWTQDRDRCTRVDEATAEGLALLMLDQLPEESPF